MSVRQDRRGSQRLAVLLEDEGALATATDEDRVLAQLAAALREVPTDVPPMRPEFRDELRASVLQAARDQRSEPVLLTRLRDGARRMRYSTAALTGASTAAMALSGGGVALAAEHAQPDDLLYDVKLALEDLRLTLTFDQVARGERAMSYAFDRLEEARTAARGGADADAAAATALYGAAERITEGSTALLDSGLVDPVVGLAGDLSAQVAILEQLRPDLGPQGTEAADAVMAAIIEATEGVLEIIDISQWPGSDVPTLPDLAVPQQTPEATATPAPGVTTPPVDSSTPGGTPSPTDIESTGGPLLPGLDLPGVPLPGVTQPDVPVPQPGEPPPIDPDIPGPSITDPVEGGPDDLDDAVDDAGDGIGDVIDEVEDAVDDGGDGVGDVVDDAVDEVVPEPVQSALPDPVEDVVEDVPSTIDDVVDTIPEVSDPVTDAADEVEDAVDGLLPGLGGG